MARIRTIKPEFWTDEKLSLLDPVTRLVFLGLISMADDAGRLVDNVKLLDGMLFPNTDDTCRDALETLARLSRITRYRVASGQQLIQIAKWEDHQKVDRPSKHVLPGPDMAVMVQPIVPVEDTPPLARDSRETRESVARDSRSDLGPRTVDRGPRTSVARDADAPAKPRGGLGVLPKDLCDGAWKFWGATIGGVDYGRFRKALLPVFQTAERPPTLEDLTNTITVFDELRAAEDPKWRTKYTVESWAGQYADLLRLAALPLVDEWGMFTERGIAAGLAKGAA